MPILRWQYTFILFIFAFTHDKTVTSPPFFCFTTFHNEIFFLKAVCFIWKRIKSTSFIGIIILFLLHSTRCTHSVLHSHLNQQQTLEVAYYFHKNCKQFIWECNFIINVWNFYSNLNKKIHKKNKSDTLKLFIKILTTLPNSFSSSFFWSKIILKI